MRQRVIILSIFIIIAALLLPNAGRAQAEVQLGTLDVNLWPEYDRPEILVIYKIALQPDTEVKDLVFRIPKEAGRPFKVAGWAEDGNLYEIPYLYQAGSEWGVVSFNASLLQYQIEYYDPGLFKQGQARTYTYTWPGDYAVTSASFHVQQPLDASEMKFSVGDVSNYKSIDDVLYYAVQVGTLSQGEVYKFELSYTKTSNLLTYEAQKVHPDGVLPESMWDRSLPWALGVLAFALIAGGVWVYWRSGQPQAGEKKRRKKKASRQPKAESTEDTATYCHSCGRRANPGDVFCRSCGTKLRI